MGTKPLRPLRFARCHCPLSALACHLPRPGESFLVGEALAFRDVFQQTSINLSKTTPLCQGLSCQESWRRRRLRGWTKDAFRVSGITQVLLCTTSPSSSLRSMPPPLVGEALAFRDVFQQNQISFIEHETSPTSSRQLIQREPLAVIADFADCQCLSLWERCLRSRWRGQARQNETRKRSDTMSLTNRVCIAVRFAFCQHPCPLRRIRASSPKGRASGEEALCISPIHTGIYYTDTTKWVGGNGICLW